MNNASNSKSGPPKRTALKVFYALPILFVFGLCGYLVWMRATRQGPPIHHISSKPFASVRIDGLTANLFTQGDQLRAAGNDLFIEFRDGQGHLTDVGEATLGLELKMPDLVMHSMGKVMRTATPGQYRTTLDPQMAGNWTGRIGFSGPRGTTETNFSATVK
ncbi:MAG: hypothetical protein ACLQU4_19740 [Limisphaerales bacterium]